MYCEDISMTLPLNMFFNSLTDLFQFKLILLDSSLDVYKYTLKQEFRIKE